jgi:two-component system chemotaxis response regulator CheB
VPKTIRIAIVDESARARGFIAIALQEVSGLEVVASVPNADQLSAAMAPDIIFVDVGTNGGLEALAKLSQSLPGAKVIALAGNSEAGIQAMVKAMQHGAADCMIKILPTEHVEKSKIFVRDIKIKMNEFMASVGLSTAAKGTEVSSSKTVAKEPEAKLVFQPKPVMFLPKALAIASSTGGPKSLVSVFEKLKGKKFSIPVFITQHMPKDFTKHFAKQLEEAIGLPTAEGADGTVVAPGHVYVAPGDYHMQVKKNAAGAVVIRLNQNPPENFCRPAADPMIRSLVEVYGGHGVLLAVLTGMGSDGQKAAEILVKEGGLVIAQDKSTSVVWGMPGAVATAGLTHKLYPLDDIHFGIIEHSSGRIA